jgi:hypothetical protein
MGTGIFARRLFGIGAIGCGPVITCKGGVSGEVSAFALAVGTVTSRQLETKMLFTQEF